MFLHYPSLGVLKIHMMFNFVQRLRSSGIRIRNLRTQFVLIAICLVTCSSGVKVFFNKCRICECFEYLFFCSDRVQGSRSEKLAGRTPNATLVSAAKRVLPMGIPDPDVRGYNLWAPLLRLGTFPNFLLEFSRYQIIIQLFWVQVNGLPFNHYSWLTTHNSYALAGARSATGSIILAPMNQEDTVAQQLKVRFSSLFFSFLFFFFNMI